MWREFIVNYAKENGLRFEMISAYTADNVRTSYWRNNSVFQKLKGDNSDIIKANCMAHIVHSSAQYFGEKSSIDIECVVNKTFSHSSSSTKCTEELKSVFAFVEEEYQSMWGHFPTRWLSMWPAVKRLHISWAAVKSYFLSLGKEQCPKSL